MKSRRVRWFLLAAWVGVGLAGAPAEAEGPTDAATERTRETMRGIFAAFASLVGEASDPERFAQKDRQQGLLATLGTLRTHIAELEGGGRLTEAHLSARRSLSDDVAATIDAVAVGRLDGARFLIGQMTEDCVACHTKLPNEHAFDLGARLLESPPIKDMTLGRRALIAVAARQFETSLTLHEQLLSDRSYSGVEIALSGALESYLKIALRVLDEPARAIEALSEFRDRSDVPRYLAGEIEVWVATLRAEPPAAPPESLARARQWIRAGRMQTTYPGDRQGLVNFVLASRDLHRHVLTRPEDPSEVAETFYWLGLCEIQISPSLWVSEAEDFLEKAVRSEPSSRHARNAYAALEAFFIEGFTGSAGTHLPLEVERRLEELRGLIDDSRSTMHLEAPIAKEETG